MGAQKAGIMTFPIPTIPDPQDDGFDEMECWLCGGSGWVEGELSEPEQTACHECGDNGANE